MLSVKRILIGCLLLVAFAGVTGCSHDNTGTQENQTLTKERQDKINNRKAQDNAG